MRKESDEIAFRRGDLRTPEAKTGLHKQTRLSVQR